MATQLKKSLIEILLADDDMDDRFFFEKALSQLPLRAKLTTVSNGEQLMDYLKANSSHPPDVLFLDLNMPRKNGFECIKEIKANLITSTIPIIIYSTSLGKLIADELYQAGAHYYFQKSSSDLPRVMEHIFTLLENNGYQRPRREEFIVDFAQM